MWADLFHYVQVVGWRWFLVVGSGFIAVADVTKKVFPSWQKWADAHHLTADRRRLIEIAFLVAAVLWAGFSAWEEEHKVRLDLEIKLAQAQKDGAYWRSRASVPEQAQPSPNRPHDNNNAEKRAQLSRAVSFRNAGVGVQSINNDRFLNGVSFVIINHGQDTMGVIVKKAVVTLDGKKIGELIDKKTHFLPGGDQIMFAQIPLSPPLPVTNAMRGYMDVNVEYDDVQPTGKRGIYIRYQFDPTVGGASPTVVDEREY